MRASRWSDVHFGRIAEGAGILVLGVAVMVGSARMPLFNAGVPQLWNSPGIVPFGIGVVLSVLGFASLLTRDTLREVVSRVQEPEDDQAHTESKVESHEAHDPWRLAAIIGLTSGYVALIGKVQFVVLTAVFVVTVVLTYELGFRDRPKRHRSLMSALFLGIVTASIVSFVFAKIFLVRLP